MTFLSSADLANRLGAFLQTDALFLAQGENPAPFPRPIVHYDTTTVSQDDNIEICLVSSGFKLAQGSLGGRGQGTVMIDYQFALIIYVYSETRDQARSDLRDKLAMTAMEALMHYEVDKTAGSQYWYLMHFPNGEIESTNHTQIGWRASAIHFSLKSRQTKT